MFGQGNVAFKAIPTPSGAAPPFALNAADNGLSVDVITGHIVLGDPAPAAFGSAGSLLNDRDINLNTFILRATDNGNPYLILDPTNQKVSIGDNTGIFGGGVLEIDYIAKSVVLRADNGNSMALTLDSTNLIGELGDLAGSGNGTRLRINDTLQVVDILNGAIPRRFLSLDRTNDIYQIGDIDIATNGTKFLIDNAQRQASIVDGFVKIGLFIDLNTGQYVIGDQAGGTNGTRLDIQDNAALAEIKTNISNMLTLDQGGGFYRFGDMAGAANGGVVDLNDAGNVLNLFNTAGTLGININGVAGFTGTVVAPATITVNNGIVTNVA